MRLRSTAVAILLVAVSAGCSVQTNVPPEGSVGRWQVIPLPTVDRRGDQAAILLDTQTGDTWASRRFNNWQKMGREVPAPPSPEK